MVELTLDRGLFSSIAYLFTGPFPTGRLLPRPTNGVLAEEEREPSPRMEVCSFLIFFSGNIVYRVLFLLWGNNILCFIGDVNNGVA